MKEIELVQKRKPREKHFLQEDGTIVAKVYSDDIHYLKNGKYEEIDNTLKKENDYYTNKSNDYEVKFKEDGKDSLMRMTKDDNYIDIKLKNANNTKMRRMKSTSKLVEDVAYENVVEDVSIEYKALPTKVKETMVLKNSNQTEFTFTIDTNLILEKCDNYIIAKKENKTIFTIDSPYMEDSKGELNHNVDYSLIETLNGYELCLSLDKEWLELETTRYPVYVDPTITNQNQAISLQDTYIYPGDTNDDRNSKTYLKAGVEKVNGSPRVNRTLIRFSLPEIGTGSEVIDAGVYLIPYKKTNTNQEKTVYLMESHQITNDWNETNATWNSMNDKFNSKIESIGEFERSTINDSNLIYRTIAFNITRLVKKWYKDTPNYGIMIKSCEEKYRDENYPMFFSKNNNLNGNAQPVAYITYRNYNGLESYWEYRKQAFTDGISYVNMYNGNLTSQFNLGNIIGGALPITLDLVYNTNDVILKKETFFGKGYKLNLEQFIKIEDETKLEYIDEDGTIHYFNKENYNSILSNNKDSNTYYDEDGLNLKIIKENENYVMIDSEGSKKIFSKKDNKYHLSKITDTNDNTIEILFNSNNSIQKIVDKFDNEISIIYDENNIIINSPSIITTLNYEGKILTSLQTKNGVTIFKYNNLNLLSSITDVTGLKIEYRYFDNSPYKVKKVTQYSVNNKIGQFYSLEYNGDTTIVVESNNRVEVLHFNQKGNLVSRDNLSSINDISTAYSIKTAYGNANTENRIVSDIFPIRYIKNYLKNSGFEKDIDNFSVEDGIAKSFDMTNVYSGLRSLKVVSTIKNKSMSQSMVVEKGKYYTFSGYFKSNIPICISLSYKDSTGCKVKSIENIGIEENFDRSDVTIYYDETATSELEITITLLEMGEIYIDDIQLEEGEVANYFNILENSDFSEGLADWSLSASRETEKLNPNDYITVVSINDKNDKALKVRNTPLTGTSFSKKFDIKGKKGNLYALSFWYKNEGVLQYAPNTGSNFQIFYEPYNDDNGHCIASYNLESTSENEWRYFIHKERAIEDFKSITVNFYQSGDANDFYITNLSFYNDITSGEYKYDENGNLISLEDQSNIKDTLKYDKNNRIVEVINSLGNKFTYEYDLEKNDRVISLFSGNGLVDNISYDQYGNPVKLTMSKKNVKEITEGIFKIRKKGTKKYLKAELDNVFLETNDCSNTLWKFEKNGDKFKIIYAINPEYSMRYENGNIILSRVNKNNLFNFIEDEKGGYYITFEEQQESKTITKYLCSSENMLKSKIYDGNTSDITFYVELNSDLFTEMSYNYDEKGKFITKFTDINNSTTLYQYDSNSGLLKTVTSPKGTITIYEYNDKNQLKSSSLSNRIINYEYNDKNLISEIKQGTKNYKIKYDDFLNVKQTTLGNSIIFLTNNYEENNGNLASIKYGNNHMISFEYDSFDRISTIRKMDDNYSYKYDNSGNIAKIISNNYISRYYYDESKRLCKYKRNNLMIKYEYDSNNNIINKYFKINNLDRNQNINFDNYENISSLNFGDRIVNYSYDALNRIIKKTIPGIIETQYIYQNQGRRTSNFIKSYITNNEQYTYNYDNENNIIDIYCDNKLIRHYEYDEIGELINEFNYSNNTQINYTYDNSGNILKKDIIDIMSNNKIRGYTYEYGNIEWEDQLTAFDSEVIAYDNVGNPTKIGDANLTWINGNSLETYIDDVNHIYITYKYDLDGIRTSKIVNGNESEYYSFNNMLLCEKRTNDLLYYIYDNEGLIGLEHNGNQYYYVKNMQDDIIGILNESGEEIVKYEYDGWGNILKITDKDGNLIIDENHIGRLNPFRYKSYYYDEDTNLYYINNRYYNPKWGRFISPDAILGANQDILSYNLYAYVSNNPINNYDYNGYIVGKIFKSITKTIKKAASKASKKTTKTKKSTPQPKKSNTNLPNYSAQLNTVLHNNATTAAYYNQVLTSEVNKMDYFESMENHGMPWDYKREENWERDIKVPYLGVDVPFIYNGEITTAEDFGNTHYGYIGKVMGFSDHLLYMAGGYAHCGVDIKILVGPYHCDDANDHRAIKRGIDMYKYGIRH